MYLILTASMPVLMLFSVLAFPIYQALDRWNQAIQDQRSPRILERMKFVNRDTNVVVRQITFDL